MNPPASPAHPVLLLYWVAPLELQEVRAVGPGHPVPGGLQGHSFPPGGLQREPVVRGHVVTSWARINGVGIAGTRVRVLQVPGIGSSRHSPIFLRRHRVSRISHHFVIITIIVNVFIISRCAGGFLVFPRYPRIGSAVRLRSSPLLRQPVAKEGRIVGPGFSLSVVVGPLRRVVRRRRVVPAGVETFRFGRSVGVQRLPSFSV